MKGDEFNEEGGYRISGRNPSDIPRCSGCFYWVRDGLKGWGKCSAWGSDDWRHEDTTCHKWGKR